MNNEHDKNWIWPCQPRMSLRMASIEERNFSSSMIDPVLDFISDDYLRKYASGIVFIDEDSWLFYVPYFMCYTIRNHRDKSDVLIFEFIKSLELTDFYMPRLLRLRRIQLEMIIWFLTCMQKNDFSYYIEDVLSNLKEIEK